MFDILGPGSLELFPCSTDVLGTICTYVTPYLSRSEPASKIDFKRYGTNYVFF